jgi:hypothetical protein
LRRNIRRHGAKEWVVAEIMFGNPNGVGYTFDNPYQAFNTTDASGYNPWNVYNSTQFTPPPPMHPSGWAFTPAAPTDPSVFAFHAPSGQQALANDPGYQWRMDQGRKALEASAAARGGLFSGATGKALVDYGQGLASQEYDKAYGRALGENQLAFGRTRDANQDWEQRRLAANQLGYNRDYQASQDAFQRGLMLNELDYDRLSQADALGYGRAQQQNADEYARGLEEYKTNLAAQLGLRQQNWNELAGLAGIGQSTNQLLANLGLNLGTQQGNNMLSGAAATGAGQVGASNAWGNALSGLGGAGNSLMQYYLLNQLMGR